MPVAYAIVAIGTAVYGAVETKRANDSAARTAASVADYNAKLDRADAEQIELDAKTNIASLRKDATTYMSRQTSAYAAAGIRTDTGSPLAVEAATAGKYELQAQRLWSDANAKAEHLESQAQAGLRQGEAQADQYHMQGVAAVLNGASKVSGQIYGAYRGGDFASTGSPDLSAGLRDPSPMPSGGPQ